MYEVMFDTRQFNNKVDWPADGSLPWYWSMGDNTVSLLFFFAFFSDSFPICRCEIALDPPYTPFNYPSILILPPLILSYPIYFPRDI